MAINSKYKVNEQIKSKSVRLVASDGSQQGIYSIQDALKLAKEQNLDLVEMYSASDVPVCKLLDLAKFLYEQKKKYKENQKKNRKVQVEIKEIWLRPVTEKHDLETKIRKAKSFLKEGNKVKFVVKFKGREITHVDQGKNLLDVVLSNFEDVKIESPISQQGRQLILVIS